MPVTYPLDLSGNATSNLVQNELHTVNEAVFRDYHFIVPNFSPFYVDNFQITYILNGNNRILQEGVDYDFVLPYLTGIRVAGKPLYGAITIHNLDLNGILSFTYQTLGGEHIADRYYVLNMLAEKAYNPRTTVWENVTDKPCAFPPTPHYQDYDNFYGQEEVVAKLDEIKNAIAGNYTGLTNILREFTAQYGYGSYCGNINTQLETLRDSIQQLDDYIAGINNRMNNVEVRMTQTDTKIDEVASELSLHIGYSSNESSSADITMQ